MTDHQGWRLPATAGAMFSVAGVCFLVVFLLGPSSVLNLLAALLLLASGVVNLRAALTRRHSSR